MLRWILAMICGTRQTKVGKRVEQRARLGVESLEDRNCPVVHSFSAAAGVSPSPNAGGTPANAIVREALGGIPAPVVATDLRAEGVPFEDLHVPANPKGNQ